MVHNLLMSLTETLKQIESELSTADVRLKQVQGKLYVETRYTKTSEWSADVEKIRAVAKLAQERIGRESTREKAIAGGFWNMGHFCKERVTMCVRVKLTEAEHTAVLLGGTP